jgi:hypothetical protein
MGDVGGAGDAFVFEGTNGVNVGAFSAGEGGEGAKRILNFAEDEFLDGGHGGGCIFAEGGKISTGR